MMLARNLLSFSLLAMFLVLACPSKVDAQIRVLSQGDSRLEWRKTQLAVLDQQLAQESLPEAVREELNAQRHWLSEWEPGKQTEGSLWEPPKNATTPTAEPIIDPAKLAADLRKRLLGPKAKPTTKDTNELEKLLKEHPNDVGIRQLHLHWLDQKQYRKQYPIEIAEAAITLNTMLELAKAPPDEFKLARAHCLYRRARALAYRELPDVLEKHPIKDRAEYEAELVGAYEQLKSLVGHRPEFILIDVRMKRRDGYYGQALELLTDYGAWIEPEWFLKKRRDLLRDLGWEVPAEEAAAIYAAAYPESAKAETANDGNIADLLD